MGERQADLGLQLSHTGADITGLIAKAPENSSRGTANTSQVLFREAFGSQHRANFVLMRAKTGNDHCLDSFRLGDDFDLGGKLCGIEPLKERSQRGTRNSPCRNRQVLPLQRLGNIQGEVSPREQCFHLVLERSQSMLCILESPLENTRILHHVRIATERVRCGSACDVLTCHVGFVWEEALNQALLGRVDLCEKSQCRTGEVQFTGHLRQRTFPL